VRSTPRRGDRGAPGAIGGPGPVILFGTGNMLSDIYDCCLASRLQVSAIFLNAAEEVRPRTKSLSTRLAELGEHPAVARIEEFVPVPGEQYFLVPTTPAKRRLADELRARFGIAFARLVHPSAYVSPYARLGEGVFVGARSVVAAGAVLADHVFVNRGVTVGHDTTIGEYAQLQPGCNVGGHVRIGRAALIGIGAQVQQELEVGPGAAVAAGAAVVEDVPERALVAGVPATVKRINPAGPDD
jgi:sugar O-acyltransferase (sialic acid O-acetyltransferase NeuD family)